MQWIWIFVNTWTIFISILYFFLLGGEVVMYHIIITAPWRVDELKASNLPKIFNFFLQKDLLSCTFPPFFCQLKQKIYFTIDFIPAKFHNYSKCESVDIFQRRITLFLLVLPHINSCDPFILCSCEITWQTKKISPLLENLCPPN